MTLVRNVYDSNGDLASALRKLPSELVKYKNSFMVFRGIPDFYVGYALADVNITTSKTALICDI